MGLSCYVVFDCGISLWRRRLGMNIFLSHSSRGRTLQCVCSLQSLWLVWISASTSRATVSLLQQLDIITPFQLYFNPNLIFNHYELWRLVTNFLFFGPIGFNFLFNMIFMYPLHIAMCLVVSNCKMCVVFVCVCLCMYSSLCAYMNLPY